MRHSIARAIYLCGIFLTARTQETDEDIASQVSIPPISFESNSNIFSNNGISITCIDCSVTGDVSASAGCSDCVVLENMPNTNFSVLPFGYNNGPWLVGQIDNFKVHMEMDFDMRPGGGADVTGPSELEIGLAQYIPGIGDLLNGGIPIPVPVGPLPITVEFVFNPTIHAVFNSTAPARFTYGFDFEIPNDSAIYFEFLDASNVQAVHFNESTITPMAFSSSNGDNDFDFSLSFRPQFAVNASLDGLNEIMDVFEDLSDAPDQEFDFSVSAYADVPQLDISVAQVQNALRDCTPAPAGTDGGEVYANLTHVQTTLSFDLGIDITGLDDTEIDLGEPQVLDDQCLDYSEDEDELTPVPESADDEGHGTPAAADDDDSGVMGRAVDVSLLLSAVAAVMVSIA